MTMINWDPLSEGQTGSDKIATGTVVPLQLSDVTTMADLSREGVWFTQAPCLTQLSKPVDPLVDFLSRRPDMEVRLLLCPRPFFIGMANGKSDMKHWNHAVFWVPQSKWELIADHLQNCAFVGPNEYVTTKLLAATIPDWPLLKRSVVLPEHCRVPVMVCGLVSPAWQLEAIEPQNKYDPTTITRRANHAGGTASGG